MAESLSPLNQLADNISGSVSGLVSDVLGLGDADKSMPKAASTKAVNSVLANLTKGNWLKLNFPYTFSVVNLGGANTQNPFTDFSLPLAPYSIKQSEEFAISIRPTQGGTTTTHGGNRYMVLNIKGTTGISPFRGAGGVRTKTGEAIFQPKTLKYRSGFEVFTRFRNWLRAYYEYKKTAGAAAASLRLVFKNYKDGEFLICELLKFDMDRQAPRSFLYDYDLEFKVLSHLTFEEVKNRTTLFEQILDAVNDGLEVSRGVFLETQDILRQVEATYESIVVEPMRMAALAVKAATGVVTVAGDMGNKAIKDTVSAAATLAILLGIKKQQQDSANTGGGDPRINAVVLPTDLQSAANTQGPNAIINLNSALLSLSPSVFPKATQNALAKDQASAQALTRSFYLNMLANLERLKQNAEDQFNLGSAQYDAIFNRTATTKADPTKVITDRELSLLKAFNDAIQAIEQLLSVEDLFKSTFDARIQDMLNRFNGNISLQALPAVRQIIYVSGLTMEKMAQAELGDSSRWGEIAEVNGLLSPYISTDPNDSRDYVLKPGDKVLIPTQVSSGFSQAPPVGEIKTTVGLSEVEKSLASDLKLTPKFDLALTSSGDFDVVSGYQNMAQAVLLKLGYEKGELMRYPELGAGIIPGVKFPDLDTIKDGVTNTLLQDSRVEGVQNLTLQRDSDGLFVRFNLIVKHVDVPVPIKIKVA